MTPSQQRALVALLREGDAATVNMVKAELVQGGPERIEEYQNLLAQSPDDDKASAHIREVIGRIEQALNLGNISRGLAKLKTFAQLEELNWDIARAEQPDFNGGPYARQLDSWAEGLKASLSPGCTIQEQVRALTRYLAFEQKLTGNHHDYYHPRNCHLPWVMEFRQGLPLTLTLIYILVGRRAGLEVEGISAPGHFLARLGPVCFDPYYDGRIITAEEWERITAEVAIEHRPLLNKACTPIQMMHRLLINLRNAYIKRDDTIQQKRIDHYLAVLQH